MITWTARAALAVRTTGGRIRALMARREFGGAPDPGNSVLINAVVVGFLAALVGVVTWWVG